MLTDVEQTAAATASEFGVQGAALVTDVRDAAAVETAFATLEDVIALEERLLVATVARVLDRRAEDLKLVERDTSKGYTDVDVVIPAA